MFRYPFLWKRRHEASAIERRQSRPACLAVTTATAGSETLLFLLSITTQPPIRSWLAVEVTPMEARRAKLGTDKPCRVMQDEIDIDIVERCWLFEDRTPLGAFSPAFANRIRRALLAAAKASRAGIVTGGAER